MRHDDLRQGKVDRIGVGDQGPLHVTVCTLVRKRAKNAPLGQFQGETAAIISSEFADEAFTVGNIERIKSQSKCIVLFAAEILGGVLIHGLKVNFLDGAAPDFPFVLKVAAGGLGNEGEGGVVGHAEGQPFEAVFGIDAGETEGEAIGTGCAMDSSGLRFEKAGVFAKGRHGGWEVG